MKVTFQPTQLSSEIINVEAESGVSLLELAQDHGMIPMGDACGGHAACSTCHVHIVEGFDSLAEMDEDEDDVLGRAEDIRAESRLGCQVLVADEDLVVSITAGSQEAFFNENPDLRP